MERLTDIELIETYQKAKEINCSQEFLSLLVLEMNKRKIKMNHYQLKKATT